MDDWEEYCYDSEHREFFALLRQRHIVVSAAYECMSCSENFLDRLLQWSVVSQAEYDDLLYSSKALLRSATNKKLLDLVNQKSRTLQRIFADLLHRYQPGLVDDSERLVLPGKEIAKLLLYILKQCKCKTIQLMLARDRGSTVSV